MAIHLAGLYLLEQVSLIYIVALVNVNFVSAQVYRAAGLSYCSNLVARFIINLHHGHPAGTGGTRSSLAGTGTAGSGKASFDSKPSATMDRDDFSFIGSHSRHAALLAEAVVVLLNVSHFLAVLHDGVLVRLSA